MWKPLTSLAHCAGVSLLIIAAALSAHVPTPPAKTVVRQAHARVHIIKPAIAAARHWRPGRDRQQVERLVASADGQVERLRLTEYE